VTFQKQDDEMRIVDVDDRTFMVVDEQPSWNVYTVYRDNALVANEAIKKTNICVTCGKTCATHLHHFKLEPLHPTRNLIEVCDGPGSCHEKLHRKAREFEN
jgi:hypothetical protein